MITSTQTRPASSRKIQRIVRVELDRLSNLPDCIISHIFSRLPTRDAVRTSVLSKQWKYKWTSSDKIELDDKTAFRNNTENASFVNFVERTLFLSQNVRDFRLRCSKKYDLSRMVAWVSVALSRGVPSIDIDYQGEGIVLPVNLLNCYCLGNLTLKMRSTFKVPATISFLYLTKLCLEGVDISNELSNSDLVKLKFAVLKTLNLDRCRWLNVKFVEIHAPRMTFLVYETPYDDVDALVNDYSITIIADSLTWFRAWGGLPENIVLCGSAPLSATLWNHRETNEPRFLEKSGLQIRKLLKGLLNLKHLALTGQVAKAIAHSKAGLSIHKFQKMEQLVLYSSCNTKTLFELLDAAPLLKFLDIDLTDWNDCDYDYDANEYTTSGIVSQLEKVEFDDFGGEMHEFKLVKFLLKNALRLERICLSIREDPDPRMPRREIADELSTYPKASTCLTIIVE